MFGNCFDLVVLGFGADDEGEEGDAGAGFFEVKVEGDGCAGFGGEEGDDCGVAVAFGVDFGALEFVKARGS